MRQHASSWQHYQHKEISFVSGKKPQTQLFHAPLSPIVLEQGPSSTTSCIASSRK